MLAEGLLVGAWIAVWATIWFALKLLLRGSWVSNTTGVLL